MRAPLLLVMLVGACVKEPLPFESCFDPSAPLPTVDDAPTYFADIKPVIDQKCIRCHQTGDIGPFPLTTHDEIEPLKDLVKLAVVDRTMPPFQAVDCCNTYRDDFSLTDDEIALISRWVDDGAPPGDPASEPAPRAQIGGLSRVDVVVDVGEPYIVNPAPGRTDDFRCFIVDWPLDRDVFVTGLNPVPSNREVVHHIVVLVVEGQELDEARDLDAQDDLPGFACEGGTGQVRTTGHLGGSLLGADFPEGFGHPMPAGAKILLNVHYSLAHLQSGDVADQLAVELKVDDVATPIRSIPIANPAWLVGDAFRIAADDAAVFRVELEPTLFTRNRRVQILGVTPHMHAYGKSMGVALTRDTGARDCLLELPRWDFGWEQPYWLQDPVVLERDDKILLECHFANTFSYAADGSVQPSRDIAWGEGDQDMCAAFLQVADAP